MYYVFDTQLYIVQSRAVPVPVLLLVCVLILEHKSGWNYVASCCPLVQPSVVHFIYVKFKLQRALELKFVCICLTFGQPPRIMQSCQDPMCVIQQLFLLNIYIHTYQHRSLCRLLTCTCIYIETIFYTCTFLCIYGIVCCDVNYITYCKTPYAVVIAYMHTFICMYWY